MNRKRLFSSDEVIAALQRAGFETFRKSRGSHQTYKRQRPDGRHDVTVVPLGISFFPKGTPNSILEQCGISYEEFMDLTTVKRKDKK